MMKILNAWERPVYMVSSQPQRRSSGVRGDTKPARRHCAYANENRVQLGNADKMDKFRAVRLMLLAMLLYVGSE